MAQPAARDVLEDGAQLAEMAEADVHAPRHARRCALPAAGRRQQHLDEIVERLAHRRIDGVEAHGDGVPVGASVRRMTSAITVMSSPDSDGRNSSMVSPTRPTVLRRRRSARRPSTDRAASRFDVAVARECDRDGRRDVDAGVDPVLLIPHGRSTIVS